MIVSDTNVLIHLFVESESTPFARQLMILDPEWVSSILWRSEFRNALVRCLRAGVLRPDKAFKIMAEAESRMAGHEFLMASEKVLGLAVSAACSAYDAEYVVLARELRVPLVTTDKELLKKFPGTAVTPEEFLAR